MSDQSTDAELARLLKELTSNPETRTDTLRMIKANRPEINLPELEAHESIEAIRADFTSQLEAMRAEMNTQMSNSALDSRRREVADKHNMSVNDVVEKLEPLIASRKVNDYDTAEEFHRMQNLLATPTPHRHARPKLFEGVNLEAFRIDPEGAALDQMYKDFDDIKNGTVRIN
jgi:hypothetical protein